MAYAKGTYALGICDRCGWAYAYLELRKEWQGLKVCPECYEPKAPQLDPLPQVLVAEALYDPRPNVDKPSGRGKVTTAGPSTTADIIGTNFPNSITDPFKMTGEIGTLSVNVS